ncbi:MAG: glycosyltransferase family 2 protein [Coriobacteriia bacterium]
MEQTASITDTHVIVVAHNAGDLLLSSVHSAVEQVGAANVTLIDSGSSDGAPERVAETYEGIMLLRVPNSGFAAANNAALGRVETPFVLLLNPDAVLQPGALTSLRRCADEHPRAGIIGPQVMSPGGLVQADSYGNFPTLRSLLLLKTWRLWQRTKGNDTLSPREFDRCTAVDWTTGACMLVRTQAVAEVGPMDEGFFLYYEDVDWCHRMRDAGWDVLVDPAARCIHHLGQSATPDGFVSRAYRQSFYRYADKYHLTGLRLVARLGLALRGLLRGGGR